LFVHTDIVISALEYDAQATTVVVRVWLLPWLCLRQKRGELELTGIFRKNVILVQKSSKNFCRTVIFCGESVIETKTEAVGGPVGVGGGRAPCFVRTHRTKKVSHHQESGMEIK
jgi:hypothetical protein